MSQFSQLTLTQIPHRPKFWRVHRALHYVGARRKFTVPPGFVSDGGTIPRIVWPVFGHPFDENARAHVLHDHLYNTGEVSRWDADGLYRRTLRQLGVSYWERYAMWAGVRVGGWVRWNKYRKRKA